MITSIEITEENAGIRLDALLAELLDGVSRSYVQKLFSRELIKVNGEVCTIKKTIPQVGDIVEIDLEIDENGLILKDEDYRSRVPQGEDIPLNIVFENHDYIVIDKPVGMVVHPGVGNESGTIVNGLINYLGEGFLSEMSEVCDRERPGIVHRIDKDTTGLIVVSKSKESYMDLKSQFRDHSITRIYTALVHNNFEQDSGRIDLPIGRDPKNRLKKKVNGLESRSAITNYKGIERIGNYTLINAILETGRTHQIRVHMASTGHPVVGDPVYGPRRDPLNAGGQMLHAGVLGFTDLQGNRLEFGSELPEHFLSVLNKARKRSGLL